MADDKALIGGENKMDSLLHSNETITDLHIQTILTHIVHDARTPLAILQMLLIPISKKIPELQYELFKKSVDELHEIIARIETYSVRC